MELHKRARSDAAHRAEEEVREYLQQFYCRIIPEEEFEAFLGACAELENHRRDGGAPADGRRAARRFPPLVDRKTLLEELGLPAATDVSQSGAQFAAAVKRALGGGFSAADRRRIVQCFDLAGLFKVGSLLADFDVAAYDVFPHVRAACPEGVRALCPDGAEEDRRQRWQALNARGSRVRNVWFGHPNAHTFAKMDPNRWQADVAVMETLVSTLRTEELAEAADRAAACLARARALELVGVKTLAQRAGCGEADVLAALKAAGVAVEEGTCCGVEAELISRVGGYARAREQERRGRQLQTELEQARTELERRAKADAGLQRVQERLFTQKLSAVPPLDLLENYAGGTLDRRALQELTATHRFLLDDSLLRRDDERRFVEGPLLDALRRAGRDPRQALLVEATALYRLMRDTEERERLYRGMLRCAGDGSRAAELEELQRRREQLTPSKNAYLFVRNSLKLGPAGYPDPGRSNDAALLEFLEDHCFERICVLTAGPTALTGLLDREKTPFAVIARVSRGPAGAEAECVCRVFRASLPFAGVRQDDPLLQGLRRKTERMYRQALDAAQRARWQKEDVLGEMHRMVAEREAAVPLSQRPAAPAGASRSRGAVAPGQPSAVAPGQPSAVDPGQPSAAAPDPSPADDTPLALARPVQPGDELFTEEGRPVRLAAPLTEGGEAARGGEGAIYLCQGQQGLVAKIYHPDQLTAERRNKLRAMLARDPGLRGLCWPVHLLNNGEGQFVGYLMERAPEGAMPFSKTVLKIGGRAVHEELLKGWTRRDLIRSALRAAQLMDSLHRQNILMGDVNAGNFMVDLTNSGSVCIVDTDSFQFGGYPCPVGTDEFTCPFVRQGGENVPRPRGPVRYGRLMRSLEEEQFSLAVLLFEILFCGLNPFVNKGEEDFLTCMRERRFPYAAQNGVPWSVPDGDNWMIWKNLPAAVTTAFTDTFVAWRPRSAGQWARVLRRYLELVEKGIFTDELTPVKYHEFNRENPFFADVRCPSALCGHREFNMPREQLAGIAASRSPQGRDALFCRSCRSFLALRGEERAGETVTCSVCGKPFYPTIRQVFYHDADAPQFADAAYICDDCANPTVRCACCGQTMRVTRQRLLQAREKKWDLYCQDCLQPAEASCACCGAPVSVPRWQQAQSERGSRVLLCERCNSADTLTARCGSCGQTFEVAKNVFIGVRRGGKTLLCRSCLRGSRPPRAPRPE